MSIFKFQRKNMLNPVTLWSKARAASLWLQRSGGVLGGRRNRTWAGVGGRRSFEEEEPL